jgi:hypothetical protein
MKSHILEISGLKFVLGLWWHPVDRNGRQRAFAKDLALESIKDGKRLNAMVQIAAPAQVGVTVMTGRKKLPKAYSLASVVMQVLEKKHPNARINALIRLPLSGGLEWCCCIIDGVFVPDGDFVGTVNEVESVYEQNTAESNDWLLHVVLDSEDEALEELEKLIFGLDLKSVSKLELIKRPPFLIYSAIGLILFIILANIGIGQYKKWRDARELAQIQEQMRQHKKKKVVVKDLPDVVELFPPHWNNYPAPQAVLSNCYASTASRYLYSVGWALTSVQCSGAVAEFRYEITRHGSYLRLPDGTRQRPDEAKMQVSFQRLNLQGLSTRPQEDQLLSLSRIVGTLYELAKSYHTNISVSLTKQGARTVKGPDGPVEILAPYREGAFSFSSGLAHELITSGLLSMPGLVVTSVEYLVSGNVWKISGKYYAQLQ